jgi:protocatechuate 3,4-dioxygenase alpha subunit
MKPTSAQTIGPFWHLIRDPREADLTRFGAEGARIVLTGSVLDGDGAPVTDACVEIWQTNPATSRFFGWGRCETDARGEFRFTTLAPDEPKSDGAPRIMVMLHARGLLKPLATCAYFASDARNTSDPLLRAIGDAARRATLMARATDASTWRFDIRLQGDGETVFLEL